MKIKKNKLKKTYMHVVRSVNHRETDFQFNLVFSFKQLAIELLKHF